jgi:cysteine desulfurase
MPAADSPPIYLDYAASTPVDPEVIEAMTAALRSPALVANAAAGSHAAGRHAAAVLEAARADVAGLINADPDEIVFTSGATEADNLAILGAARFLESRGRHLVTSLTEHRAVLESCRHLASRGWRVTWLKPDGSGRVAPEALADALCPDTVLVSLMHVNNETGAVQDLAAFGRICRARGVLLHVDAAQGAGRLPIDVRAQAIDLLSLSAHKLYGPKGIGALFIDRQRVRRVEPLMYGGGQERGLRPGTLPTHQIIGMGLAFRLAGPRREADRRHVTALRDRLWSRLEAIPGVLCNGDPAHAAGHILNVSVAGVEGESLHAGLQGLAVASGAACTSLTGEPSHVLRVLGRSAALARSSVRFSFGRPTTTDDVDRAAAVFEGIVAELRARSPAFAMVPTLPVAGVLVRGEAGSAEGGTWVFVTATVQDGVASGLAVRVFGCPHTMLACDRVAQRLDGRLLTEFARLDPLALASELKIPPEKAGRLLIVQDALRNCLADWENRGLSRTP